MELRPESRFPLNDGNAMPVLGLGVWQIPSGAATVRAVRAALDLGYRHIDTAKLYGNEADVGRAVRESGIPREEVFVTTKLWNTDHGYASALKAGHESNERLGLGSIDLYLIHSPVPGAREETWEAMVRLREEGVARSIGVSNFTRRDLEELRRASDIVPAVNQVEFHPFRFQADLLADCREQGILLEAYSPLTRGRRLDDPTIVRIARARRRTPAQVVLRWALQHGVAVIPKSARPERMRENRELFDFELYPEEMWALDALDDGHPTGWNPGDRP